jgi:ribosomal protein L37AE/L43A
MIVTRTLTMIWMCDKCDGSKCARIFLVTQGRGR